MLLDINLPVLGGMKVLERLAVESPGTPVVMMTSQSSMRTVLEAARLGAIGYILKHSPRAEALRLLQEALATLDGDAEESAAD